MAIECNCGSKCNCGKSDGINDYLNNIEYSDYNLISDFMDK